jgi:hypothetical protein
MMAGTVLKVEGAEKKAGAASLSSGNFILWPRQGVLGGKFLYVV